MKMPEEIKRGLEMCRQSCFICPEECPYMETPCSQGDEVMKDAHAYIQQLERDNAQKDECIRQIGKSLFKAVIQLKQFACLTCDYSDMKHLASVCSTCVNHNKWSWRGVEEDDE